MAGTNYTEIYCLNDVIKNDNRLINKPQNQIYALFSVYLDYAISYFMYDCYVDLNDRILFSQEQYYFNSDGIDKDYLLSPVPPTSCEFYVGYRATDEDIFTQTYDFVFDSLTNIITINDNIPSGYEVYISGYIIGKFNQTLNLLEKAILSNGMLVPWDQEQLNKNSLLNQMVYGGTTKIYSQGNHIKEVKTIVNNQYFNIVKGMISEYSYKANPNKVKGLGGGLV